MRHKSDAAEFFEQFLADYRADGVPSTVIIVRPDGGGETPREQLEACIDHKGLRRKSRRPTVPKSIE